MLTREEVQIIDDYCAEQGVTLSRAFTDLSVNRHQYFSAKRKYRMEDAPSATCRSSSISSRLTDDIPGDFIALPSAPSEENVMPCSEASSASSDHLSVDITFPSGVSMRMYGSISPDTLCRTIVSLCHVQS